MTSNPLQRNTTSFVAEVLATAGRLEKDDLNAKLGKLSKRIEEVKSEVYDALQRKYGDFYPNFNSATDLSCRVHNLSDEMSLVSSAVESEIKTKLDVSTTEFHDLSQQLEESNYVMMMLDRLVKLHDAQQHVDTALKNKDYVKAAEHLQVSKDLLDVPCTKRDSEIRILKSLLNNHSDQMTKLIYDLGESWGQCVKWKLPKAGSENTKKTLIAELQITKREGEKNILADLTQAMQSMDLLSSKLQQLSDRLMEHLFQPLYARSAILKLHSSGDKLEISVSIKGNGKEKAKPEKLLMETISIMTALEKHLLGMKVHMNKTSTAVLMQLLGAAMAVPFQNLVIKECLSRTIPSNNKDLKDYAKVVQTVQMFQKKLCDMKFLETNNKALMEYVENVNVLFANKKSEELLQQARTLMTSEIHNVVQIAGIDGDENLRENAIGDGAPNKKQQKMADNVAIASENRLSPNTFRLPQCHISVSTRDLVKLAYDTLHEATTSSPECATQLFYSVRNMFELFCNVVPTYHKDSLSKLPQLAAIHHNNCMYIAYHLMTLGHQFRPKLPLSEGATTFVDMVPKMRRLGTECFLQQMSTQKKQLVEYIASAQGFNEVSVDDNFSNARRAIKQALHQLQRLHNVWVEVLPENIYFNAIGTLTNSVIVEVVNSITALEDISASDANQLHSLLAVIGEKTPDFFKPKAENADEEPQQPAMMLIAKHISKWNKLQEFMLLLKASLQEILDRWADSKGPLANEFAANEVKQLIRALFQNTDQRANVLAKIR